MWGALWTAIKWVAHVCWSAIRWAVAHPIASTLIGVGLYAVAAWIRAEGSWGWAEFLRAPLMWSLETASGLFFWTGIVAGLVPGAQRVIESTLSAIGLIMGWLPVDWYHLMTHTFFIL